MGINLTVNREVLQKNMKKARECGVIIPTIKQLQNPQTIPEAIKERLLATGLWDVDPVNLFRVTWKNEPKEKGGLFGLPNFIELPKALTGVDARIICMTGKWFPTGCHKVGASFGCLIPKLVTGQFDATYHKAVWPSTGNYCRGGAFNSKLLSVDSVAILPEGMSRERFEWLESIAGEIIATPGSESDVKEIFDKTWELRNTRKDVMIFNQFEEMGNHLWHYHVTGSAIAEAFESIKGKNGKLAAVCTLSGSGGSTGCGDFLKEKYPHIKQVVGEALQCSTLLNNGFGEHRIEGIGDKHVPWVHNVKNTDIVVAINDDDSQHLIRMFHEPAGQRYMIDELKVDPEVVGSLGLLGISGVANVLCAIKTAKYYEMTSDDVIATILTDSASMYGSRIAELAEQEGGYTAMKAAHDYALHMLGVGTGNMEELTYYGKKRIHNLKYYTWVEQQGRTADELNALWYDFDGTWGAVHRQADAVDKLIEEFNDGAGVL
ncbi:MAG: pyridoxal-phosphate dependent enzyme [Oscillospiraceae bacterium]|nr:pyridoxal-phosphate dependent enzyme [Oscillospiraceae bacterium]